MDLSMAFDYTAKELLIAKMETYGFSENALTFFFFLLKWQKQSVQINKTSSIFLPDSRELIQKWINLFCWWQNNFLHSTSLNELISEWEKEGKFNTAKFQAIVIDWKI